MEDKISEETKKQNKMQDKTKNPNKEEKIEKEENKDNKIAEPPKKEIEKEKKEKTEVKKETKKTEEKKLKTEAVVNARDLGISTKHSIAICNFIRGRKIEEASSLLQEVVNMRRAVPMRGEIPHRKGRMMSGRYPVKAAQQFIKLLKQLAANAVVNEIDLEKARIECKADKASCPYKKGGRMRAKRTHVMLKLKLPTKIKSKK